METTDLAIYTDVWILYTDVYVYVYGNFQIAFQASTIASRIEPKSTRKLQRLPPPFPTSGIQSQDAMQTHAVTK